MLPPIPPPAQRLLVFARVPELGRVKTRLAATLGDKRTLEIYGAMLRDVLGSIGQAGEELEIEVMWAPTENATGARLRAAFGDLPLAMQTGATLGDRLAMAFSERFFFHRTNKVIAIGVDDPGLSRETIDHAFALLDSCEWVLGPASDGGYYLIGCRSAAFESSVFAGIVWGTATVLDSTLSKLAALKSSVAMLAVRSDIDVVEDLERFAKSDTKGELAELLKTVSS